MTTHVLQRGATQRDQLEELAEVVSGDTTLQGVKLPLKARRLLGALLKHDLVTKDVAFTAMYFDVHVDDRPDISTVGVYLSNLRRFLIANGVEIQLQRGEGWYLKNDDKEKLHSIIAGMKVVKLPLGIKKNGGVFAPARDSYKVEYDIPIPPKSESNRKYPWDKLDRVGASIEVKATRMNIQKSFSIWRRQHPDRKYLTRSTADGVRVWRIE